jgi:hypothetical protein
MKLQKKLSTTTPPAATGILNPRAAYARVIQLETELGLEPSLPIFSRDKSNARILHLESQLAARTKSEPAVIAAEAVAAAARAVTTAAFGESLTASKTPAAATSPNAGPLKVSLSEYRSMDPARRAQFGADGGTLALEDFNALSAQGKMDFMKSAGRIFEGVQNSLAARASQAAFAAANKPAAVAPEKIKPRADFEKLTPKARMEFLRNGGQLTD